MSDLVSTLRAPNGVQYQQPLGLFINNKWVAGVLGEKIASISPINESEICSVHSAGASDIDTAVRAARKAFKPWRKVTPSERGRLLWKLADLIEQHAEILATIDAWDSGKTYQSSLTEDVVDSAGVLRYYAGFSDKLKGSVIEPHPSKLAYTTREPVGVCGLIAPWNYPLVNVTWKLAPALAAGNTVVVKTSEETPLSALYLANLVLAAGFPAGVVNIMTGLGRTAGTALVQHTDVNLISFTGSTATAKEIMKLAAGTLKVVTLEAGGKSPLIVFEDADLQQAVRWAHAGIMSNQGQICSATSRILVQREVYEQFVTSFKEVVESSSMIGDSFEETTYQGPQVSQGQFQRVMSYIESGKKEGATLELGGKAIQITNGKGWYIAPTIFTNVTPQMTIYREEIFGPVVVINTFSTEEEAIERANDTIFGLGASIFTRDITRAHLVAKEIEAGTVWINSSNDADYRIPFGGKKQSGIGREWGEQGLLEFTSLKSVHVNLGSRL